MSAEDIVFGRESQQRNSAKNADLAKSARLVDEIDDLMPDLKTAMERSGYEFGWTQPNTLTVDGKRRVGWVVHSGYDDYIYLLGDGCFVDSDGHHLKLRTDRDSDVVDSILRSLRTIMERCN